MAIVHEVFAQVFEGEVKNVMVCDSYPMADYLTKCTYGAAAFAVDCLQYRCGIGDKYHDGFFWHIDPESGEEVQIPYTPTEEQEVTVLKEENTSLQLALTKQYEENLALQEELTNTQMALVELYERGGAV